ncbi:hypothetical protein V8G54_010842 [Vigna mungo]|uniref:Uncharacterized protein n=1 Tax=Vigna mungo TaxID=3915 RepID=A0AAQ3NYR3_VIGMU
MLISTPFPPNKAKFSCLSTLQHKMLPPEHTFHVFGESIQEDSVEESASSMDLMLAFPLVVHVSRVQYLESNSEFCFPNKCKPTMLFSSERTSRPLPSEIVV